MSEPKTAIERVPLSSGHTRRWLAPLAAALAAGSVLAVCEPRVPSAVGFSLTLLTAAVLGLWAGRRRGSSAFWWGAAITFIAVLTSGLIRVVVVYRSSPYDQPAVLPPAMLLVAAMLVMALAWGAAGGVFAYTARRVRKR